MYVHVHVHVHVRSSRIRYVGCRSTSSLIINFILCHIFESMSGILCCTKYGVSDLQRHAWLFKLQLLGRITINSIKVGVGLPWNVIITLWLTKLFNWSYIIKTCIIIIIICIYPNRSLAPVCCCICIIYIYSPSYVSLRTSCNNSSIFH